MKSKLTVSEFKAKLNGNTKIGHPKLKLSPFGMFTVFGESSKKFYGIFDNSSFYLTDNFSIFQTPFLIKGNYKTINRETQIQYQIVPRHKFQNIWFAFVPIFGFLMININSSKNNITANLFLMLMFGFAFWNIKYKKRKLEGKFIQIFEIE